MVSQELLDYIQAELHQGVDAADIAANLATHGWSSDDIRIAFGRLGFDTESTARRGIPAVGRISTFVRGHLLLAAIGLGIASASGATVVLLHMVKPPAPPRVANTPAALRPHPTSTQSTQAPAPTSAVPCRLTVTPLPTASEHPLSFYPFPQETISYPSDVPDPLRLPEQFRPVEISGEPTGTPVMWTMKFRVAMPSCDATRALESFFGGKGWQVDTTDLGSGEANVVIRTESASRSGFLTVDPDTEDPMQTRVLLVFSY